MYPDRTRLHDHDGDAVLEEPAYLTSKLRSLEHDLDARRRRAARSTAISTAALAVAAVAAVAGARLVTRSTHADLLTWRNAIALSAAAAAAGLVAGVFAARRAVRSLVT